MSATMTKSALLPCPFCGGSDLRVVGVTADDYEGYQMECLTCHADGPVKSTEAKARVAWNRHAERKR